MWNIFRLFSLFFRIFPVGITRIIWRLLDIFDGRVGAVLRYIIISSRLKRCGENIYFGPFVYIDDFSNLCIGSNVSIHNGVTLLSKGGICIGDNVAIAHGASIVTGNHTWADTTIPIKYNPVSLNSVNVENDVWIGAGVRVLAGVTIGSRTVVAAGAVINKSVIAGAIYGGIPAKKIKNII